MHLTYTFPHPLPFNKLYVRMEGGLGTQQTGEFQLCPGARKVLARWGGECWVDQAPGSERRPHAWREDASHSAAGLRLKAPRFMKRPGFKPRPQTFRVQFLNVVIVTRSWVWEGLAYTTAISPRTPAEESTLQEPPPDFISKGLWLKGLPPLGAGNRLLQAAPRAWPCLEAPQNTSASAPGRNR